MLYALRARGQAQGEVAKNRILSQFGLDPLSQASALQTEQGKIEDARIAAQNERDKAAYLKQAQAFATANPGLGPMAAYTLAQSGDSAATRQAATAKMADYGQLHAGPSLFQRMQLQQNQAQFDQSYKLDQIRTNAQVAASMAARVGATNSDQLAGLKYLSTDYQTNMKAPVEVADAVQQIGNGLKTGNSLGSLAAVIKLAKILDPTSVVREGEVTTVQGGIGTASALINEFNRLGGKGMTPQAAEQFKNVVLQIAGPVLQRGLRLGAEYKASAEKLGVPGDLVTTGVGFPEGFVTRYLQGFPDPEVDTTY